MFKMFIGGTKHRCNSKKNKTKKLYATDRRGNTLDGL